jgi:hypothetical protein
MSGPAYEGARKNATFRAICTAPSINKTPVGNSTPPLPYITIQDLSNSVAVVPNVTLNGACAYVLDQSIQPSCTGDEAGTKKGVKSGTTSGYVKPTKSSTTVTMGGLYAVRFNDPCLMNGGNNPGLYITDGPAAANPAKTAEKTSNPAKELETPEEKSSFEKFWDQLKEEVSAAFDNPKEGAKGAAKEVINTPSEIGEMLIQNEAAQQAAEYEESAMWLDLLGFSEAAQDTRSVAEATREFGNQAELPKAGMSNTAQAGGSKIVSGFELFIGAAGMLKSAAKSVSGLFKGMAKEADPGKVKDVSKAGDTAKTADNTKPEGSAGEVTSPGDGVVVKPAGSGSGSGVPKGEGKPKVTAEAEIDGQKITGTNQSARDPDLADPNKSTLAGDTIQYGECPCRSRSNSEG